MKKLLISIMLLMPLAVSAQSTLTPQQQLEQAQKQLEEAKKALEAAKARQAAEEKAQKEAEEKARAEAEKIQKEIEETRRETERVKAETERLAAGHQVADTAATPPTVSTPEPTVTPNTDNSWQTTNDSQDIVTRRGTKPKDGTNSDAIYLTPDAVPVVDGQVEWHAVIKAPGKTAAQVYDITEQYLTKLTSDELQLAGSQLAIKDKSKSNLVATVHEWLVFHSSAISLDRTEIYYLLNATCHDGYVDITMNRVRYQYNVQGKVENYKAENWITDKVSVNKKRTRLYPGTGKFRRKTIDRKNEIFTTLQEALTK